MRSRWIVIVVVLAISMIFSVAHAQDAQTPAEICEAASPATETEPQTFDAPEQVLEEGVDYRAVLCTDAGPIYVDLLEKYTPVTVNSFVFLAQQGFYDNTTFHRVIEQFMAQGGDPEGTGRGGPGYRFPDEFVGFLHFDQPGWLAMANAGPGTNGSQFFITTVPTPHLDYKHTIFGEVLEGQSNVEGLTLRDPETAEEPGDTLLTVVIVTEPETVSTTFEPLSAATQDEVTELFDSITGLLPPEVLVLDEEVSGVFTTDQLLDTLPETVREDYAAYFSEHNHEYRAANKILNPGCDLQNIAFVSVGYSLDAYPTPDDAAAALADPALSDLMTAQGFTENDESDGGLTVFTSEGTGCDADVQTALTHWQRGRFVSTVEITIPATVEAPLDQILSNFVGQQIFERILSDVLRPEIR